MQHLVRPVARSDIDRLVPAFGWLVEPPGHQPRGEEHFPVGRIAAHRFCRREAPTWETVCFGWKL